MTVASTGRINWRWCMSSCTLHRTPENSLNTEGLRRITSTERSDANKTSPLNSAACLERIFPTSLAQEYPMVQKPTHSHIHRRQAKSSRSPQSDIIIHRLSSQ